VKIPDYPEYLSAEFAQRFGNFQLEIRHDDGLYRHLVFRDPKTTMERFEIITWPRHLYVGGDWEGFTFSRLEDMFEFFRYPDPFLTGKMGAPNRINPHYWSEKIVDGYERAKEYCRDFVAKQIWQEVREDYRSGMAPKGLAKQVQCELFEDWDDCLCTWDLAMAAIRDFSHDKWRFSEDAWEWPHTTWANHYLLACHAIVAIIAAYDAAKAVPSEISQALCADDIHEADGSCCDKAAA